MTQLPHEVRSFLPSPFSSPHCLWFFTVNAPQDGLLLSPCRPSPFPVHPSTWFMHGCLHSFATAAPPHCCTEIAPKVLCFASQAQVGAFLKSDPRFPTYHTSKLPKKSINCANGAEHPRHARGCRACWGPPLSSGAISCLWFQQEKREPPK